MQVAMKRTDSSNAMSSCLALRYYALLFIHYPTDREYSNVFPIAFVHCTSKHHHVEWIPNTDHFFLSLSIQQNHLLHIFKTITSINFWQQTRAKVRDYWKTEVQNKKSFKNYSFCEMVCGPKSPRRHKKKIHLVKHVWSLELYVK